MADVSIEKQISDIHKLLAETERNVATIKNLLKTLETDSKKDQYRDVPGIVGKFDGNVLVTESGETHSVPENYAAKSRLVYGDSLKLIEENGKQVFKQIDKVSRKKIEGILTKKEGKWYILSDAGSYKISDNAAEFNKAQLNDEAVALIPEEDTTAPFAALDVIKKKKQEQKPVDPKDKPQQAHTPNTHDRANSSTSSKNDTSDNVSKAGAKSSTKSKPVPPKPKTDSKSSAPKKSTKKSSSKKLPPQDNRPSNPSKSKEFVEDIVSNSDSKSSQTPAEAPAASKELDDDDLR